MDWFRLRFTRWEHTRNAEYPYSAMVNGKEWLIRVNDFPQEHLYSLIVDGREQVGFDSWPPLWVKPKAPPSCADK